MCLWKVERDNDDVEEEDDEDDALKTLTDQRDQLEKTVDSLKRKLDKSDAEHNKVYEKMKKVNDRWRCLVSENDTLAFYITIILSMYQFKNKQHIMNRLCVIKQKTTF